MDKEASVWSIDPAREKLIRKVQRGTATLPTLINNGATQYGAESDNYDLASCLDTGAGCTDVYAVSIPGVTPSRFITWFQAAAACRNASKRLLTNAEWQTAALGTPDPGTAGDGVTTCNTTAAQPVATGSGGACRSDAGVFDMVGNVWESGSRTGCKEIVFLGRLRRAQLAQPMEMTSCLGPTRRKRKAVDSTSLQLWSVAVVSSLAI